MKNTELIAVFQFEKRRFVNAEQDTIIATFMPPDSAPVATKGPEPDGGFEQGKTYLLGGSWQTYRRGNYSQEQFCYSTVVEAPPFNKAGVIKFLCGVEGIGPATAKAIWETCGEKCLEIIPLLDDRELEVFSLELKVPIDTARKLRRLIQVMKDQILTLVDLMGLFDGKGFPKTMPQRCWSKWFVKAPEIIRKNPYRLLQFGGVGFRRCDNLYSAMRLPPSAMKRQAICAWHGIDRETRGGTGSTWIEAKHARGAVRGLIGDAEAQPAKALKLALRGSLLKAKYTNSDGVPQWDGDSLYLADQKNADRETELAKMICRAMSDEGKFAWNLDGLSDHQSGKIAKLANSPGCLKILRGGGGTGKTFTLGKLVSGWIDQFGKDQIGLAAPTGKAAVRIQASLAANGISIPAMTWHRLLEYRGTFIRNEGNPFPYKVVIGDEQSMQDLDMCYRAFAARPAGCLFLLIGDTHQLSPVAHGAPLRDMIAAGVPSVELTKIERNFGAIVLEGKRMRESGEIQFGNDYEGENDNLHMVECSTAEQQLSEMLNILKLMDDPVAECQVLTSTNKGQDLGRRDLNRLLQNQLNGSPAVPGSPFRFGDKVVNLKNGFATPIDASDDAITNEKGMVYVANGEVGRVVECKPTLMQVELPDPYRLINVPRKAGTKVASTPDMDDADALIAPAKDDDGDNGCSWDLAYALSVHKFQGSQAPNVIVMIDAKSGGRVHSREWLYTAISRAEKHSYIIGKEAELHRMCKVTKTAERKTFLKELICDSRESITTTSSIPSCSSPEKTVAPGYSNPSLAEI